MKKIGLYSVVLAALLVGGCTQKSVQVEAESTGTQTQDTLSTKLDAVDSVTLDFVEGFDDGGDWRNARVFSTMIDGKLVQLTSLYFPFDKYHLTEDMITRAKDNSQSILSVGRDVSITLEGNTDEWGTDEYNYALGLKRANTAKQALVADGVNAATITMVSLGEGSPVCTEKTKECWQMNRRVDYKVMP
ncbi:MAG: OmpA family protein [Arcobacter butzleri]|jgi:peptidoglycan-associated lipoprotein|nr:OmpA family protein [Arcobacteraceae bacterium]MDY0364760.1 OmpA family protein [Arcobacteraceae bacterium]NLO17726.1 OmpA family protein [Aliarcobacter butzleri]